MRNLSKLLAAVGILGMASVASAKGASIDDMFARANSKTSSSKHSAPAPKGKVARAAKGKPAMQPRMAAAAKAPNRAPKAEAAPPSAQPSAPSAAPSANTSNTMVLADFAPERHALAGP